MVVGLSLTRGSQFFFQSNCLGKMCCVPMPFCYVVAFPFSASLRVIVHAQFLVWGLVSCWFDYCALLLKTKLHEFTCLSG